MSELRIEKLKVRSRKRLTLLTFYFLLLASFALRLWRLDAQSLWFDEGWSWHLASMPLGEMAITTAGDRSPPLYYALLHAWIQLAGQSEFAMRFISAMADTATVALVVAFTTSLMSRGARALGCRGAPALMAGAMYAISPFVVWYAQETRMYALVAALCTASSYWLWRWLQDARHKTQDARCKMQDARCKMQDAIGHTPYDFAYHVSRSAYSNRYLIASAVLLALAIYCHYYAIFLLPAQFLVALTSSLRNRNSQFSILPLRFASGTFRNFQFLVAAACIIASLIPWLLIASTGFAYDDGFAFPLNTIDGRLLEWVRSFASGGLPRSLPDTWPWWLAIAGMLGAMGFVVNGRWRELLVVLALIVGPLLAATIAVRLVYPYRSVFHPRYLIYVAPMICVLFGGAGALVLNSIGTFSRIPSFISRLSSFILRIFRISPFILVGALWLPTLYAYFTDPALQRDDARQATRHVVEALAPDDVVIMSRDNFAVRYYWPQDKADALLAMPHGLHGVLADDADVIARLNRAQPVRVRLMLWQDDVVDPQKFVESTLWPNGYEIGEYNFAQIRLPLYQVVQQPITRAPFEDTDVTFSASDGGDQLALRRYWQRAGGVAGDWFYVILEWEPRQPMRKDYKVFVHVLDGDDKVVFQNDKLPLNALLPMTRWQPGQPMRDAHAMIVPADLPAGVYRVVVGVYDPAGPRLLARSGSGAADLGTSVPLGEVEVTRR